jgi:hypothetical protein
MRADRLVEPKQTPGMYQLGVGASESLYMSGQTQHPSEHIDNICTIDMIAHASSASSSGPVLTGLR